MKNTCENLVTNSPLVEGGENYLEQAHLDWVIRRAEVLRGLRATHNQLSRMGWPCPCIKQAIEFIEEGEI